MNSTRMVTRPELDRPDTDQRLTYFPRLTLDQLEEALEERIGDRRISTAKGYPKALERRVAERRQT